MLLSWASHPGSARARELLRPAVPDRAPHRPRVESALEQLLAELALGRHAQEGGFPANRISEVKTMIDPSTAEAA